MSNTNLTYEKAYTELQAIMTELQNDQISVDDLSKKVERAAELIKFCKGKLSTTEKRVKDIIEDLGL